MKGILFVLTLLMVAGVARADMDDVRAAVRQGDYETAIPLLEDEAMRNNVEAAYELAMLYRDGEGVPADPKRALKWLTRASRTDWKRLPYKFGYPDAQYVLGQMYLEGRGTPPDAEEAADWYERAAEQGHAEAQLALAELYYQGQRIAADPVAAYVWASLAAESPHDEVSEKAVSIRDALEKRLTPAAMREAKNDIEGLSRW